MVSNPLAEKTIDRAAAALRANSTSSCLPELVKVLQSLSAKIQDVDVSELADLIQKDTTILAKVIGAANTLGYNITGMPINTVSQAIHVIGYDRVRTLAMSLLLVEHTTRTCSPAEQQEATALALTSGFVAQTAAERNPSVDGEEAFVCASLRNFGRLVLTTFMVEDYRRAQNLCNNSGDDEAFRRVFGLSPLELGRELLRAENLPDPIMKALRECQPESLSVLDGSPDAQLLALADFSAKLAHLSICSQLSAEAFAKETAALAKHYSRLVPGLEGEVSDLLKVAEAQLSAFVRHFSVKNLSPHSMGRLKQRAVGAQPSPAPIFQSNATATAPPPVANLDNTTQVALAANQTFAAGVAQLNRLLSTSNPSRSAVFALVLEIVQKGFSTPDCFLFSNQADASEFTITHSRGELVRSVQAIARIRPDERTVFGVCLRQRENVLIHNSADPKIIPYIPSWIAERPLLGAFALLPLIDQKQVHGLILAGWKSAHQIVIPHENAKLIRTLLALVSRVCER